MLAPLLDQSAGDRIGASEYCDGRCQAPSVSICRFTSGENFFHISSSVKSTAGAISTRPAIEPRRPCALQLSRQQQREPAAHRRADQHLRALGEALEHRGAVLKPAADGAVGEFAAGFAVAGIVEPDAGAAVLAGPVVERDGLGALHVGLEAAEPEQPRRRAVPDPHRDPARGRPVPTSIGTFRTLFRRHRLGPSEWRRSKHVKVGDFSRKRR